MEEKKIYKDRSMELLPSSRSLSLSFFSLSFWRLKFFEIPQSEKESEISNCRQTPAVYIFFAKGPFSGKIYIYYCC